MKWWLLWMVLFGVAGCNLGERNQHATNQPMQIRFENATVRQYKGSKLRFEIKAAVVELCEDTQEILASGGVYATTEPKLWDGKQP